jgi:large subunit ribosomal protein L3
VSEQDAQVSASETGKVKLEGAYFFKEGMGQFFDETGRAIPVTVLKWVPWYVTQIKTLDKEGYSAVQISGVGKKPKNAKKAELGHAAKAGLKTAFRLVREIKQKSEGVSLGAEVDIESISKGDLVKVTSKSKGKGFQGSVKRWNFAGGPASHGSKFHRQPGSSGNRTWPGRVMPGKKFPGHLGDEQVTLRNVKVIEVRAEDNVILVKGPVPGARNTLVKLSRQSR